jgi:hypothetical protein
MTERELLRVYGTTIIELTGRMIAQAAHHDLRIRAGKHRKVPTEPTLVPLPDTPPQWEVPHGHHFLFHRRHVARARDAEHLITLAINDRDRGARSGKYATRLIYSDADVLYDGLAYAREAPSAEEQRIFETYLAMQQKEETQ